MNRTHFRILDTLSRCLGAQPSVSQLTDLVQQRHGTAHYKNVHQAVEELDQAGYLETARDGRGTAVSLNLERTETVDVLAEVELQAKRRSIEDGVRLPRFQDPLVQALQDEPRVQCAFLVDAEANLALNRLQLVAIASPEPSGGSEGADADLGQARLLDLQQQLQALAHRINTRVDALVLSDTELVDALSRPAIDPLQWLASRRTALVDPQRFWWLIANAHEEGRSPRMHPTFESSDQTLDLRNLLTESDLARNLARFGYEEMGTSGDEGRPICLELALVGALASDRPRRRYAAAVLLAKNSWNPRLLAFLARSTNLDADLSAFLHHLHQRRARDRISITLDLLPTLEGDDVVEIDGEQVDEMLEVQT